MSDQTIENNLQAIESSVFAIAKDLNWFTPTQVKDIPHKPGWKRIGPKPAILSDAKEHQLLMDKGLGFAVAQICYGNKERLMNVFLNAMSHANLTPENYDTFVETFNQCIENFSFESEVES
ncbi:MAG: hypothetical protein ACOY3I_05305 [Verrucomicrobiota bacterium]